MKTVITLAVAMVLGVAAFFAGRWFSDHDVTSAEAPGGARVAFATARRCRAGTCQTLWIGSSRADASAVAVLAPGEACHEIAWTPDGARVGFLVDGYQLRLYDPSTLVPAGQLNLVEPDGRSSSRIVRGVTFSDNGRAVTFDECPRRHSGCRSGLAAIPQ